MTGGWVLTVQAVDVLHGDLAVAPHCAHHRVQLAALQAPEGHAQVVALHHEAQRALVHVQHHQQRVGQGEGLLGLQEAGVGRGRRRAPAAAAAPAAAPLSVSVATARGGMLACIAVVTVV